MLGLVRDPVFFDFNKLSAALNHFESVKSWDSQLNMRLVHSAEVLISSKHGYFVVDGAVGLGAFKALDRVVEGGVGRVELETCVRFDRRCLPATIFQVVVDLEHVVSLKSTEQVGVVETWLGFQFLSFLESHVTGQEGLLLGGKSEARCL